MGKEIGNGIKSVELFAGIGGFRIGLDRLGVETVWANDFNKEAAIVYRDKFGDKEFVEGDIWQLIDETPSHDLLTGGFPCQPFSAAGKKKVLKIPEEPYLRRLLKSWQNISRIILSSKTSNVFYLWIKENTSLQF